MNMKSEVSTCQILHACTLFPTPIDIYVNEMKCVHSLGFGEITLPFEVVSQSLPIKITSPMQPGQVLWQSQVEFPDADHFTLAITENHHTPGLSLFRDDASPVTGRTKLRMIQLSPDTEPISIANERQVLFSNVAFGEARFLTLAPYNSSLQVCFTSSNETIYRVPELDFQPGETYTLFTVGKKYQKPKFQLLLLKSNKEANNNVER
ncbi:DUF4397 domain-containing protein [Shimazuella sp. AN120528]|uniref:DUF4397 domain-containing protein n=1 Tax=Shimazuella soli TaxID=1892854 RepID=UPI001F0E80AD|nr:DUF4397 domain-containing protein [Shimazuella soli]MCH5586141.1 DUF4397 domain-containing protein [Shimazuella soli]